MAWEGRRKESGQWTEEKLSWRMSQKRITLASMETTGASQVEFTGVCVCLLQLDVIKGTFDHQQPIISTLEPLHTS